jgi:hypothetical protein
MSLHVAKMSVAQIKVLEHCAMTDGWLPDDPVVFDLDAAEELARHGYLSGDKENGFLITPRGRRFWYWGIA